MGSKYQTHCKRGHKFDETNTNVCPKTGRRTCRACKIQGEKDRRINRLGYLTAYQRDWNLRTKGWTQESFDQALKQQCNRCEICGIDIHVGVKGDSTACADHAHVEPPKPRGVLCNKCNPGLGAFKDSIDLLKKATAYLEKYA
jgi:hypothetical protein